MALRDDAVVLVAVAGVTWYFLKYLRTSTINAITDLIPAVSPPGYEELQKQGAATILEPTGKESEFTSPLADYVTKSPAETVYAMQPNDPMIYIVEISGEWRESGSTKTDLVNSSEEFVRSTTHAGMTYPQHLDRLIYNLFKW